MLMRFETKEASSRSRTFRGLASAWAVDSGGDMIEPGAYAKTLTYWRRSGNPIPLLDQHNYGSVVDRVLGKLIAAHETRSGLEATFEVAPTPAGDVALKLVAGGYVNALSIGYTATKKREPTQEERGKGVIRVLQELALYEISLVFNPMNTLARIHSPPRDDDDGKGWAPGDPRRVELEQRLRKLRFPDDDWHPDDPRRLALEDRFRRLRLSSLKS
jgi:HK97 family phage prohead protease